MVPTPIIVLLFIAAFLLVIWQYIRIDPRRRILNLRFGMMVGAIAGVFGYPLYRIYAPDRQTSWIFLGLALFWVLAASYLLRHMPPREEY